MRKNKLSFSYILIQIVLFLLLTIDAGFYATRVLSGTVRIIIAVAAIVFLILFKFEKSFTQKNFFVVLKRTFLYFVLSLIMPIIYGRYNIKQMVIMLTAWIIGYLLVLFISYDEFKSAFISIVYFLAIYSLIFFVLNIFVFNIFIPKILEQFPYIYHNGVLYYNAIFTVFSNATYVIRNYGVFWEPGTFSIYLNVALYFLLFEEKFNYKKVSILVITILTTVSTLGIICMVVLFVAYLTTRTTAATRQIKSAILFLGAIGSFFLVLYGGEFLYNVFSKLDVSRLDVSSSTSVRINAVIYPLSAFLEKPMLGVGYDDYLFIQKRFCDDMATCTFINWLCIYGIAGGTIPIIGCVRFFVINEHKFLTKIILFVFSLLLFSTENFIFINFIYMLVFFGFVKKRKRIKLIN